MILNYKEPQLNIDQKLSTEIPAVTPRQAAVIVGTQYVSPGFESNFVEAEFDSAGGNLSLTFTDTEGTKTVDEDGLVYKLDTNSLALFVKNAEYPVMAGGEGDVANGLPVSAGDAPNKIVSTINFVSLDDNLAAQLEGRPVQVGDIAYVYNATSGGTYQRRKVKGFIGADIAATFGSDTDSTNGYAGNSASNPVATTHGNGTIVDPVSPSTYALAAEVTLTNEVTHTDIQAVNKNGLSVLVDGVLKAGVRLNLRVLSYDTGTGEGTVSVTSTDGNIATTAPFALVDDDVTFDLSDSTALHGIASVVATAAVEGNPTDLIPGQVFSFTILSAYQPIATDVQLVVDGGSYTGDTDNVFYMKVVTGNHEIDDGVGVVRVYDAKGTFSPFEINVPHGDTGVITIPLGSGLSFQLVTDELYTLTQKGLRKNDIFYVSAKAATVSTVNFTGLLLDGPAALTGTPAALKLRAVATGEINEDNQLDGQGFELATDLVSVDYSPSLTWKVAGKTEGTEYVELVDGIGTIYTDWRAAKVPAAGESRLTISSAADLAQLGPIKVTNDLAFAAKKALDVSTGTTFYVIRTSGDSAEEVAAALEKLEHSDTSYALAIISEDTAAFDEAVDHAEAMSALDVKNFRRVYFGVDSPGEYAFLSKDSEGNNIQATILNYSGANRYVSFTNDIGLETSGVSAGDSVVIGEVDYVIEQILSDTELIITTASAPALPISPAVDAVIYKSNTPTNQVEYVADLAKRVANRRGVLIWCDSPVGLDEDGNYISIKTKFQAAEIAALRAIVAPQLGLTKTVVSTIVECPTMYSKFTRNLLNYAASYGVMIVTQEHEAGNVFIRHQLTTDSSNGSLFYEDSVGTNVDNISFQFKDVLDKYIGKRNVTPTTLSLLKHEVFRILEDARTTTIANLEVGPQILNFYDENGNVGKVTVKAHPTFKDRIVIKVKITIPLPLNILEVEIEAISEVVTNA